MKLNSILAIAVLSLGSLATAAQGQNVTPQSAKLVYSEYDRHEQHEYDSGYKDGSHSGMDDARHGRGFIPYDHGSYRKHHDPEYREGYERGYRDAYRANRSFRDHEGDRYWNHDRD